MPDSSQVPAYVVPALSKDYKWNKKTLTYSFAKDKKDVPEDYQKSFVAFTGEQESAAAQAIELWNEVMNIKIVAAEAGKVGDICFGAATLNGALGETSTTLVDKNLIDTVTILLKKDDDSNKNPTIGTEGFDTLLHEIGHALGLKHPGNHLKSDTPPFLPDAKEDNEKYTLMSTIEHPLQGAENFNAQTPLLYDIATIQAIYGANKETRKGDNIYTIDQLYSGTTTTIQAIWDADGKDTISIDASEKRKAHDKDSIINLNPGCFSSIGSKDYKMSNDPTERADNIAIAYGVTIENAKGGVGNDYIIGNSIDNEIIGGKGNDTIIGDDTLDGMKGQWDTLKGGEGDDSISDPNGVRLIHGEAGNDTIDVVFADYWKNGDTSKATPRSDGKIIGGTGNDTITVTMNNDKFFLNMKGDNAGVKGLSKGELDGIDTVTLLGTYQNAVVDLGGGNDFFTGGDGIDNISGSIGDDNITGGKGDDRLDGNQGDDVLSGNIGNDIYIIDSLSDIILEDGNDKQDKVISSVTRTLGSGLEILTLSGSAAIDGTGNELENTITGNSFDNKLFGKAGNDLLDGKQGTNTLDGGEGNDTYIVNSTNDTVIESSDNGEDTLKSSVTYTLASNVEDLILTGTAAIDGTGNELNNRITGNSGNNKLVGNAGEDTLIGGGGDDILVGGKDNDIFVLDKNGGKDTIQDFDLGNDFIGLKGGLNFSNFTIEGSGADTIIKQGNDILLNIIGVDSSNVGQDNFLSIGVG